MKRLALFAGLLALTACGRSNQDKLPDDLSAAEGVPMSDNETVGNYAEDVNQAAAMAAPPISRSVPAPDENVGNGEQETDTLSPRDAPSFPCDDAQSEVELWICNEPDLAALDRSLARQYQSALAAAGPAQAAILRRSAQLFLVARDNCPDRGCVAQSYRVRLREIDDIMRR